MIKNIITNKIDEINREYNIILENNSNDLNYINICSHQKNSMIKVLEEVLNEINIFKKQRSDKND